MNQVKKIKDHVKAWKKWRKKNTNGKAHKLCVLLGLVDSPTFEFEKAIMCEEELQKALERKMLCIKRLAEVEQEWNRRTGRNA